MSDKERLVELLSEAEDEYLAKVSDAATQEERYKIVMDAYGFYADHLIANGVVVRKQGHFVTDEFGDSSCSICGEKYLNITQAFCPNCSALLVEEDK